MYGIAYLSAICIFLIYGKYLVGSSVLDIEGSSLKRVYPNSCALGLQS